MKNVLVIGSGGREHTFAWKLSKDQNINKVFCIPGNGGTAGIATNHNIDIKDFNEIYNYVLAQDIDMIVVGPEAPLNDGIVDFFREKNVKIFGPDKFASQLECSKLFARDFMLKNKIPQPLYFECDTVSKAIEIKDEIGLPLVLKADGLAAGKGVIICKSESEYRDGIKMMLEDKKFGSASDKISIEECLIGEEVSVFAVCDGQNYKIIGNAQDHKRAFDKDKGPNTGGMGAYSPTFLCNQEFLKKVEDRIIKPTLKGMSETGHPFTGFLYVGLMIVDNEPYVIEFNVRMGDPETQVVIPRIKSSLYEIFNSSLNGTLEDIDIDFETNWYCTVVLASKGYPEKYIKGQEIKGVEKIKDGYLFHAGTNNTNNQYFVSGGRVLNVIGDGEDLPSAINKAYKNIENIEFENMYYRKDIGHKGLIKEKS